MDGASSHDVPWQERAQHWRHVALAASERSAQLHERCAALYEQLALRAEEQWALQRLIESAARSREVAARARSRS
ncbi:hypothetical protein [Kineococcus sp. SYSU DK005]|uniref:hypothetical protein n=1 Tax=Kineococcus sp. SYSU DK005 TaxID=3383126 RepID=UPI003D7D9C0F